MIGHKIQITGFGRAFLITRSELDAFKCTCGAPGCAEETVRIGSCGHPLEVFYAKAEGAIVLACPTCKAASAVRVAGEG